MTAFICLIFIFYFIVGRNRLLRDHNRGTLPPAKRILCHTKLEFQNPQNLCIFGSFKWNDNPLHLCLTQLEVHNNNIFVSFKETGGKFIILWRNFIFGGWKKIICCIYRYDNPENVCIIQKIIASLQHILSEFSIEKVLCILSLIEREEFFGWNAHLYCCNFTFKAFDISGRKRTAVAAYI